MKVAVYDPEHAVLDLEKLPEDFRELGSALIYYAKCVSEISEMANAMAKGNLRVKLPSADNEMASPLKTLHAALMHLTWQAQRVAKGDYKQRVDFMGDFSEAFNTMIEQLEYQRESLLNEIANVRKKQEALEQSNSLFKAITGQIFQWIIVFDVENSDWLYINHPAAKVLKYIRFEPQLRLWMQTQVEQLSCKTMPHKAEMKLQCEDTEPQYFSVVIYPLGWYEHKALAFVFTDISTEKEQLHDLQNVAYTDKLTQIYNRHYGMKVLEEWLAAKQSFVLCFIDIDNLKFVNDRFGHAEGDRYIILVTSVLKGFSPDSILCRFGGDEFVILNKNLRYDEAICRMETLKGKLAERGCCEKTRYKPVISYGAIEIGEENTLSASEILNIADEKMYEYKHAYKMAQKVMKDQDGAR